MKVSNDLNKLMRRGNWIEKNFYRSHDKSVADIIFHTISLAIFLLAVLLLPRGCEGAEIDMHKIKMIESSGCKQKFGQFEEARGCYQITPVALAEWNQYHPKDRHTLTQMLDDRLCFKVANWYMNKRIPQMLRYFKIADTVRNRIIAYNAGIDTLVKNKPLPKITVSYLKKYGPDAV